MSVLRPLRAPLRCNVARYILNLIQRVLHIRLQVRPRRHMLSAQRVARIHGQHRLHLQVLAPIEKLQQPQPVGRVVSPRARMSGPVHQRPNRLLPVEAVGNRLAFQIVPAGKAQERRMHPRQQLHQVHAIAVHPVLVRRREHRKLLHPHRPRPLNAQQDLVCRRHPGNRPRLHREVVLLPLRGQRRQQIARQHLARIVRHQAHPHRRVAHRRRIALCPHRPHIRRIPPHRHAPPSAIAQPVRVLRVGLLHRNLQARRQRSARPGRRIPRHRPARRPLRHRNPVRRIAQVQKRPVLHQLPIQPALVRVVDLLGHQPIQRRAHLRPRLPRIDRQRRRLRLRTRSVLHTHLRHSFRRSRLRL